jgi:hypothetical protein
MPMAKRVVWREDRALYKNIEYICIWVCHLSMMKYSKVKADVYFEAVLGKTHRTEF